MKDTHPRLCRGWVFFLFVGRLQMNDENKFNAKKITILPGSTIRFVDHDTEKEMVVKLFDELTVRGGIARQAFKIKGRILEEHDAKKDKKYKKARGRPNP
jgi:hypothetical protein